MSQRFVMSGASKANRNILIYLIVLWMVTNILLMLLLLTIDYKDLKNWIELALWTISIAGLVSMKNRAPPLRPSLYTILSVRA